MAEVDQVELLLGQFHLVVIARPQFVLLQQQFDLVYLGHLLHADGWEMSPQLLARSYACLRPGGLLAVAEIVASEPRARHYASNVFDLSMLMLTEHGVVFSRRELSRLREEAGFVNERWIKGPGEYPVLLAERPV
jgi:predicted O-methyltransferase YrrM